MRTFIAVLALITLFACGRAEERNTPASQLPPQPQVSAPAPTVLPGRVGGIELGNSVGADKRVTAPASSFAPTDTIYVSVLTEGEAAGGTLSARWTYEDGQLVSENQAPLATSGGSATEFHIAKPDGWPTGRYRVDIALNGQPAGSRDFEVR